MKVEVTQKQKRLDTFLWVLTFIVLIVGLWANQYFTAVEWGLRTAAALVLLAGLASLLLFASTQGRRFAMFLTTVRGELRKVAWPNRKETTQGTIMVVVAVVLVAVLLWMIDSALMWAFAFITGHHGV